MSTDLTSLASLLKKTRRDRGINQIKASNEIGIGLATLRQLEQGARATEHTITLVQSWISKKGR